MNDATQLRPVVVGTDGSDPAYQAMRWAATYAARVGAPLRVVHAHVWPAMHIADGRTELAPGLREAARATLDGAVAALADDVPGVQVEAVVVDGLATSVLVEQSTRARLVVVGTRGLGGVGALLLGSTAVELAVRAHAPVVVVRESSGADLDFRFPVLVGVDGSTPSEAALDFAFDFADQTGATVLAVHVQTPGGPPLSMLETEGDGEVAALVQTWRDKHPDVRVDSRHVAGHAAGALVDLSRDAAMVVVGSRGRGGFRGLFLGSVSQGLMHHAHCPVVVIPHEAVAHPATSSSD